MDRLDILNSAFGYVSNVADYHDLDKTTRLTEPFVERYFNNTLRDLGVTRPNKLLYDAANNATLDSEVIQLEVDFVVPSGEYAKELYGDTQSILAVGIQDVISSGITSSVPTGSGMVQIGLDRNEGVTALSAGDNYIYRALFNIEYASPGTVELDHRRSMTLKQNVSLFGSELAHLEDSTESLYSVNAFTEFFGYNTVTLPSGNYRIGWSFEWWTDTSVEDPRFAIVLDGVDPDTDENASDVLMYIRPDDPASNNFTHESSYICAGFAHRTLEGLVDIVFFVNGGSNVTFNDVSVRKMRVDIWRTDG